MKRAEDHIVAGSSEVGAITIAPEAPVAAVALAHGAGAGMRHAFLERVAIALADRRMASLRYQFPYMEAGRARPDPPAVAVTAVRAAVSFARESFPGLPLLAGGKSFGGRMTSTAAAEEPLPGVAGLVFLGFPLHPPKRPGTSRADHLARVTVPMLFLQGTRDDLADLDLVREVTGRLPLARLHVVEGADHSFAVLKRSGRTADLVLAELADTISAWAESLWPGQRRGGGG